MKRLLSSVLAACMMFSISAVGVNAASPAEVKTKDKVVSLANIEKPNVISSTTELLPSSKPHVVITQTTTVYDNDVTTVETLTQEKGQTPQVANSEITASNLATAYGATSGTYTYEVKREGLIAAKFTISGRFQYNDSAKVAKCLSYSSSKWINSNYECLKWKVYSEHGSSGLFYKAWANVKGLLHICMTGNGLLYNAGYIELKCESNGKLTTIHSVS